MIAFQPAFWHAKTKLKSNWEWLYIRQTSWQQGSEHLYVAVLRTKLTPKSPVTTVQYRRVKVVFWARRPKSILNKACSEPRTQSELARFFGSYQCPSE